MCRRQKSETHSVPTPKTSRRFSPRSFSQPSPRSAQRTNPFNVRHKCRQQNTDSLHTLLQPPSAGFPSRAAGFSLPFQISDVKQDKSDPHLPLRPHSQPRYPQRQAPPRPPRYSHHVAPAEAGLRPRRLRQLYPPTNPAWLSASARPPCEDGEGAVVGELQEEQALRRVRVAVEAHPAAEELRHLWLIVVKRVAVGWGMGFCRCAVGERKVFSKDFDGHHKEEGFEEGRRERPCGRVGHALQRKEKTTRLVRRLAQQRRATLTARERPLCGRTHTEINTPPGLRHAQPREACGMVHSPSRDHAPCPASLSRILPLFLLSLLLCSRVSTALLFSGSLAALPALLSCSPLSSFSQLSHAEALSAPRSRLLP